MDKKTLQAMADEYLGYVAAAAPQVREFQVRPPENMQEALEILRRNAAHLHLKFEELRAAISQLPDR